MSRTELSDAEKLTTALRWLESHHKRLCIEQKSLQDKLSSTDRELARISREIELAQDRLRRLTTP